MKTSEMIGAQLDWAVAKCESLCLGNDIFGLKPIVAAPIFVKKYKPSTDWALAGPIIEREGLYLRANDTNTKWACGALSINTRDKSPGPLYWADTPLVAAMRCYVASKLGDEVELPEELT